MMWVALLLLIVWFCARIPVRSLLRAMFVGFLLNAPFALFGVVLGEIAPPSALGVIVRGTAAVVLALFLARSLGLGDWFGAMEELRIPPSMRALFGLLLLQTSLLLEETAMVGRVIALRAGTWRGTLRVMRGLAEGWLHRSLRRATHTWWALEMRAGNGPPFVEGSGEKWGRPEHLAVGSAVFCVLLSVGWRCLP
jgi:energy-coupling factor transporter transmembrane protein EcfT